ncbi:2-dehydro-3-deoxy-D-gluconate 5-dehydrogenase KduD [Serpentinicella alkaliphila]|uniref:2-dehydro-3-deoxy-D-gluconate 5-dehydrogenase n=1 Tax=Serpentinicella alkaliphila TaxID=1734049 RepID=A0A4R2TVN9_9FIRM|nr:2-dehydro-3-deoxy-D-gluconate 5-dehydrogenase KduD [Serpentinicella alkaliphila]QUH26834.1 2-dehydro-3-deoxy-D-gluconate 5-dehydrogenase KduD [Serpentinicella alkaliphila]TCQ08060.1 2-deoxy-D-gluconate 3-dehydrogenase [Serpentinicella alkaliphila]
MDIFSLEGKVAMVTGCRTGLGQGMAIALAKAGADILGVGSTDLKETKELVEKVGRKFVGVQANLMEIGSIPKVMEAAMHNFGKIDILVNNAGIIRREDSINFTEQDWDEVMNINLKMVFFLSQAVAKKFIEQGTSGKIINIASMLSFQGGIRVPSYTGSKSGVKGITMLMANEWAKYNININAIAPGYMATDNTAALRADEKRSSEILSRIPSNRWGTPEDLDGAVIFLASKASDYVNGFTLAVDGGWLAR